MKLPSLVFGWVLYAVVVLLGFFYNGGHIESLFHPADLAAVALAPLVCLMTGYGWAGTLGHFRSALEADADAPGTERFLSLWIAAAYGTGFLFSVLDLLIASGFVAGSPSRIAEKAAEALTAPLFAAFLAEGLLRPLKHRVASRGGPRP